MNAVEEDEVNEEVEIKGTMETTKFTTGNAGAFMCIFSCVYILLMVMLQFK